MGSKTSFRGSGIALSPSILSEAIRTIAREQQETGCKLNTLLDRHASELGISTCSLINHWKRADPVLKLKSHGARLLSDDQELILLYAAQAFSAANEGLIPSQIKTIARELWKVELKSSWISNWLQRHKKDISFRRCVGLTKNRLDVEQLEQDLRSFIDQLTKRYKTIRFPPACIFNVDETRVAFKETGMSFKRIEWTKREKHNIVSSRQEKGAIMITFVSADGRVLLSCWIFKVDFKELDEKETTFKIKCAPKTRLATLLRILGDRLYQCGYLGNTD